MSRSCLVILASSLACTCDSALNSEFFSIWRDQIYSFTKIINNTRSDSVQVCFHFSFLSNHKPSPLRRRVTQLSEDSNDFYFSEIHGQNGG